MELITPRLLLREFHRTDKPDLLRQANNLEILRYQYLIPYPITERFLEEWFEKCERNQKEEPRQDYSFAIELESQKGLIGGIELRDVDRYSRNAIMGYWIGKDYWRKGYANEAVKKMIDFGFGGLGLIRISADPEVGNIASRRLLETLGFEHEGTRKKWVRSLATKELVDCDLYGLVRN